jgi:hypothetical protein
VSNLVMVLNSGGVAANKVCGGKVDIRILGDLCGRQWLIVFSVLAPDTHDETINKN